MIYLKHIWYVLKHKWYVGIELLKHGLVLRALTHDLSKLSLTEFKGYARWFFSGDGRQAVGEVAERSIYAKNNPKGKHYAYKDGFGYAWNHHQKHNRHHWQYYIMPKAMGYKIEQNSFVGELPYKVLPMPKNDVIEMVCDWVGAGRAITGKLDDFINWYEKNKTEMILHDDTRKYVETLIQYKAARYAKSL